MVKAKLKIKSVELLKSPPFHGFVDGKKSRKHIVSMVNCPFDQFHGVDSGNDYFMTLQAYSGILFFLHVFKAVLLMIFKWTH